MSDMRKGNQINIELTEIAQGYILQSCRDNPLRCGICYGLCTYSSRHTKGKS